MNIRSLSIATLVAGAVMAFLSHTPILYLGNCLACMWLWSSGIFGAWLYSRDEGAITPGQGAVIGIFSGLVAAILGAVLSTVFGTGLGTLISSQADRPEAAAGSILGSFAFVGAISGFNLLCNALIYPTFGGIGGAIGGVLFSSGSAPKPA